MRIYSTYFENNRADFGTAIYTTGYTEINGSVFTNNGGNASGGYNDRNVIKGYDDSVTNIAYSTFADNNALFATFGIGIDARIEIFLSIIYDVNSGDVFEYASGGTSFVGCAILHESNSLVTNFGSISIADPMFVDAANGDFHINTTLSPAVDYCSSSLAVANPDIDFQNRGYDNPDVANRLGLASNVYDIGADEAYGVYIFQDGFE